MVAFNVSLDDSSPLIAYSTSWFDTPANDSLAANYSSASLHTSSVPGATVNFTFNGTGVWLYGAHRPEYGTYKLAVDGQTVTTGNASAAVPVFDQLLGGSGNMSMGQHTVVLSNVGGDPIDLDSLVFETQIGLQDQLQVNSTTIDDSDSQISYLPSPSDWLASDREFFSNGSAHFTQTTGAQATLSFSGDAIAVYGGVSFDHGPFTISIDGQTQQLNGGGFREYHAQTMLHFAQGLGSGNHQLAVTANSGFLDLDSIIVYSASGTQNNSDPSSTPSSSANGASPSAGNNNGNQSGIPSSNGNDNHIDQSSSQDNNAASGSAFGTKSIPPTTLVAIIIAGIFGLAALLLIIFFIVRFRKHRQAAVASDAQIHSPTFIQHPDLESGGRSNVEKRGSRWTIKSFATSWSQPSFNNRGQDGEGVPALPPLPAGIASLKVPMPPSERPISSETARTGSTTLNSGEDNYYAYKKGMVVVNADSRHLSIGSSTSSSATIVPQRPPRPPGLDLVDIEL